MIERFRLFLSANSMPAIGAEFALAALLFIAPVSGRATPCEWNASEPCAEDMAVIDGRLATLNGELNYPAPSCGESDRRPGLSPAFSGNGADCTGFIHEDGNLGTHGATIQAYLDQETESSPFFNSPRPGMTDSPYICPNWERLSRREKTHFWVWVMAALAWKESTCGASLVNSVAIDGTAVGLLQLNLSYEDRYWRGPNCKVSSVRAADANLKCGLDIMKELLLGPDGDYKTSGALYRERSYWASFRAEAGGSVGDLISDFPLCRD
jgi:hypothetical protein